MRFVPRSLSGRIAMILVAGVLAVQVLAVFVLFKEGEFYMFEGGSSSLVERIRNTVTVLEALPGEQRLDMVRVLDLNPVALSLEDAPIPPVPSAGQWTRANSLAERINQAVGGKHNVQVLLIQPVTNGRPMIYSKSDSMALFAPFLKKVGLLNEVTIIAQVQLKTGEWAVFDANLRYGYSPPPSILINPLMHLLIVLAVTAFAIRLATRPIQVLGSAAESLGRDIRRPPLAEDGPVEVARAARAFNTMQKRLITYIDDRTRILAAVSHDLKTPITRLKLRTESLKDAETRVKFEADLHEMESMVAATLDFMRGLDADEPIREIDVLALLESLQRDAEELGQRVSLHYPDHVIHLFARPMALKRCLANLLDNAIKYGRRAALSVDDDGSTMTLCVRDEGAGIPPDMLERVFEPFYRLEDSRNRGSGGTGLGLSIARNVAEMHGGSIVLSNPAGGGLRATLRMPLRPKGG